MNKRFHNKEYHLLFLFILLEVINIILLGTIANLALSLPQFIIVLNYIGKDIKKAFLYHLIFTLTSFDATSASTELDLYSYCELKLLGPFTLSYIVLGLIWIRVRIQEKSLFDKTSLIYKCRNIFLYMFCYGTLVGILGFLLYPHRVTDFVVPFIYMLVGCIYLDIFIRLNNFAFLKKSYSVALLLIIASPFATFITYFILGIRAKYQIFDALIFNEEFMIAPCLLLMLLFDFNKKLILSSLLAYIFCVASAGRGGAYLNTFACIIIYIYLVYSPSFESRNPRLVKVSRYVLPYLIFLAIPYFTLIDDVTSLAVSKLNNLISMLAVLGNMGGTELESMSTSPYIRIAEICNIFHNGLNDPLSLLFGHGYGGQYTDSTGMFGNVDLSDGGGAFSMDAVKTGLFGSVHSSIPSVVLYNGVIVLILTLKLCVAYFKKIKITPLCFAAFTIFIYGMYFNPSLFVAAIFALYGAEYKINKSYLFNTKHI